MFRLFACLEVALATNVSRSLTVLPSGRVEEHFSDEFFAKLDADSAERLRLQIISDKVNEAYTPRTNATSNHVFEETILGEISFSRIVARSRFSVIYRIAQHPNLLIKYQGQCDSYDEDIHPLLLDAWYGSQANRYDLAPRIVAISPAAPLCPGRFGKCSFGISDKEFDARCGAKSSGTIRYMIMEKFEGTNLVQFRTSIYATRSGSLGLENALRLGIELMSMLRVLHEDAQIVHGDIHAGNIMIHQGIEGLSMNFIDFGMSKKISNDTLLPTTPVFPRGLWYHRSCTPWQIDGFAWARRDDVMKLIYVMYQSMHPASYIDHQALVAQAGYEHMVEWKSHSRMYVTPHYDPVEVLRVSHARKATIYDLMDKILIMARRMTINDAPPYEELISLMVSILQQLN